MGEELNGTVLTDKEGIGIDLGVKELAVCSDEKIRKESELIKRELSFICMEDFISKRI